jgi:hypothetical protein
MQDSRANSESGWDNQNVMRGQKRKARLHKMTRASILFVKMDCLVKPGNDELGYPLTRSTRATTALARNWAIIALRCFRS